MNNFKKLVIWQQARDLTIQIYKQTDKFPKAEKYGLISQLCRAANSVGANIAEGSGRYHYKDKINFLYNSRASLFETLHHLEIAQELDYIEKDDLVVLEQLIDDLSIKINNYISSLKKQLNQPLN